MRNNGILNIDVARADLPMQPEYWIEETYVSRYEKLLRVIEKKTSFLPYRNTKVIREISFEVPASTTLEQIKEVSLAFEKRFKVSCFQISIDRSVQVAHLLFAWIDMETGKAVKLDVNTLKRATGMFLRRLKLPHPKDYDKWDILVRQCLLPYLTHINNKIVSVFSVNTPKAETISLFCLFPHFSHSGNHHFIVLNIILFHLLVFQRF